MSEAATDSPVLKAILERRSIRHFTEASVARGLVLEALKAASWAPSGLNNQPWRFGLIRDDDLKARLGGLTRYTNVIKSASVLVTFFLDKDSSYDHVKDCQAVGASIQNFLLAVHARGLGAVWIGEILKNKDEIQRLLELPDRLELMAVVAVGHPAHRSQTSHRRPVEELVLFEK
ncbi:MAG: nitroreductase family protein [Syntrophobacteraceae bacterium]|jgi:nitroreductase|nr:nitroreductase family protein [Syntrophobacteraceae bacterium]